MTEKLINSQPYEGWFDWYYDTPRLKKREARKKLGLPASDDVGKLSQMLSSLRQAVEDHLARRIDTAVATWPRMRALYQEDILDALEYFGLQSPKMPLDVQLQRECKSDQKFTYTMRIAHRVQGLLSWQVSGWAFAPYEI